jgi:hypothetical protein
MNTQVENRYVKAVLDLRRAVQELVDAERKLSKAEQDYLQNGGLPRAGRAAHTQPHFQGVST